MKLRSSWSMLLVVVVALLVATGCASMPPAVAVNDLGAVAGKWEGAIQTPNGTLPAVITIDKAGTYEAVVNGRPFVGVLSLDGGRIRVKSTTTGRTGVWTLQERDGQKVLVLRGDDGKSAGEARPVK
jgi:hypothetical protein